VWHYTNADGLIGILTSGQIWSTQIACLNDSLEHRYFAGLVHAAVNVERKRNTDPDIDVLLRVADDALSNVDTSTEGRFVACFSEVRDDLAQWRGYGGGECAFSIGFRYAGILEAIKSRLDRGDGIGHLGREGRGHACRRAKDAAAGTAAREVPVRRRRRGHAYLTASTSPNCRR
jgi:hypothetical protein